METKYGFKKMSLPEFSLWLSGLRVSRTIVSIQQHHTYNPSYILFNGNNHFERQKAMKNYHINSNGWANIGQHFTIFPDGYIVTGRNIEKSSACIYGQNSKAICIENFGNFDLRKDVMTAEQKRSIIEVTALFCSKFNIPVSTDYIVYHHWFDLNTGTRNNGTKNNKSCPGTNFFGGNKVLDCQQNFLPLVNEKIQASIKTDASRVLRYVCVSTETLNVRTLPNSSSPKVLEGPSVELGAILRVYQEKDGWLKISGSDSRWVSAKYTVAATRAVVIATTLNIRTGPGASYPKDGSLAKGEIVFVTEFQDTWCKLAMEDKWVSKNFLKL